MLWGARRRLSTTSPRLLHVLAQERRFAAIKDELVSFAGAERVSVQDLIKIVYAVKVDDKNYNLNCNHE